MIQKIKCWLGYHAEEEIGESPCDKGYFLYWYDCCKKYDKKIKSEARDEKNI